MKAIVVLPADYYLDSVELNGVGKITKTEVELELNEAQYESLKRRGFVKEAPKVSQVVKKKGLDVV